MNNKKMLIVIILLLLLFLLIKFSFRENEKKIKQDNIENISYDKYQLPKPIEYSNLIDYTKQEGLTSYEILINEKKYTLSIADTDKARTRGLSNLKEMSEDQGMLFVFPDSAILGFWMKEMFFDIDIIWINEFGTIVHIEEKLTPESFPIVFKPKESAKYVIELKAGQVEKNKIKQGQNILTSDFLTNNSN